MAFKLTEKFLRIPAKITSAYGFHAERGNGGYRFREVANKLFVMGRQDTDRMIGMLGK